MQISILHMFEKLSFCYAGVYFHHVYLYACMHVYAHKHTHKHTYVCMFALFCLFGVCMHVRLRRLTSRPLPFCCIVRRICCNHRDLFDVFPRAEFTLRNGRETWPLLLLVYQSCAVVLCGLHLSCCGDGQGREQGVAHDDDQEHHKRRSGANWYDLREVHLHLMHALLLPSSGYCSSKQCSALIWKLEKEAEACKSLQGSGRVWGDGRNCSSRFACGVSSVARFFCSVYESAPFSSFMIPTHVPKHAQSMRLKANPSLTHPRSQTYGRQYVCSSSGLPHQSHGYAAIFCVACVISWTDATQSINTDAHNQSKSRCANDDEHGIW